MPADGELLEKYTRGAEGAAHSLSGLAVSTGYFSDKKCEPLLPFAEDEGSSDVQSVSGLLCRIVGQLSYWILTDAFPNDDEPEQSTPANTTVDYQKEDEYVEAAHQASGLAAAFSGTVRAGEGGQSLLNYSVENVKRMSSLISQARESLDQLQHNKPTDSNPIGALHCLLLWCENILNYATELSPIESVNDINKASPRTIRRASIMTSESSPPRDKTTRRISWSEDNEVTPTSAEISRQQAGVRPSTQGSISMPWAVNIPRPQTATPGHGGSGVLVTTPNSSDPRPANNSPLFPSSSKQYPPPSNLPVSEEKLKHLFYQYDTEGLGWITRQDMRDIWEDMDVVGLPQYRDRLEDTLSKYSLHNGRVSYDEYCIVMLKLMSL